MSETVRNYTGSRPLNTRGRAKGWGWGKGVVLAVLMGLMGYGCWTTRSNYAMERLIPANQSYQIFANDLLSKRSSLAASPLWQAIPSTVGTSSVPDLLNRNMGMPEWVLNNLAPNTCTVSGRDMKHWSDVLFVSQMSRVGTLLQRLTRFIPGIERDVAGGLNLRCVKSADIYFAVRGRMLAVSPSRDTLIRALTLRGEDALPKGAVGRALSESGSEDLRGLVSLSPGDPLSDVFKTVSFALRVDPSGAVMKCRAALRPEWQARAQELWGEWTPQPLIAPPDGMLQVSLNLGKPVREVWRGIGQFLGRQDEMERLWQQLAGQSGPGPKGLPGVATALFGPLGPGLRLSWCGMDLDEMIPVPELVATFDGDQDTLRQVLGALPPPPPNAHPWDMYVHVDPATQRLSLPLIGGPSIEPTAGPYGSGLLLSTSATVADSLLRAGTEPAPLPQAGNLYVHMQPNACLKAAHDWAALLAENNLLKWTPEKIEEISAPWLAGTALIEGVTALVSCEKSEVSAELALKCAGKS